MQEASSKYSNISKNGFFLSIVLLRFVTSVAFEITMTGQTSLSKRVQFITNKMCPFAQKAWIALEASNTSYQMEEISLYGAGGKPKWFLSLNPEGTVPVLSIDDGKTVITDSELILDYIASGENDITSSYDKNDVILLSKVKTWRKVIAEKVIPIGKSAVLGGSQDQLFSLLAEIDDMVEGPFLCGNIVTVADCSAFPFIWRIDQEFGVDGKLKDWLNVCENKEAFKNSIQRVWWWWW